MSTYNQDDKVGPWADEKLKCLTNYLEEYTTILKGYSFNFFYFDAFAGAGQSELRSDKGSPDQAFFDFSTKDPGEKIYIEGSPRRALMIKHPFNHYFLVEKNRKRAAELKKLKAEFGEFRSITVIHGDARTAINQFINSPAHNWKECRAVMFLDPFGMQVTWDLIEKIANTKAIEIILNFPVGMAIQRLLPASGSFTPTQEAKLNEYLGSDGWKNILYHKSPTFFGEEGIEKATQSGERLVKWYGGRLKNLFGHSPPPKLITNPHGSHLYYLMFAGPNATGAKIAKHILGQSKI